MECEQCFDHGFVDLQGRIEPCPCTKVTYRRELSFMHENKDGFETALIAMDLVHYNWRGQVEYAQRLWHIMPPRWLYRWYFKSEPWW